MWEEVTVALTEKRRELVLAGKSVAERVEKSGLDERIFQLESLNFLELSCGATLGRLPDSIGNLQNLTTLLLKGNGLEQLPALVGQLCLLKVLDISMNKLSSLPNLSGLSQLTTLNVSINSLAGSFPDIGLGKCGKMSLLDVSVNQLEDLTCLELCKLEHLAELNASKNALRSISHHVTTNWPALKKLDLSQNSLKAVPAELGDLQKLKELSIVENQLTDNRLKKMAAQKTTKSVLDYIRQNCAKSAQQPDQDMRNGGGGKKGKQNQQQDHSQQEADLLADRMTVMAINETNPEVIVTTAVKDVRPYIVVCYVRDIDLSGENMKKFISLQTKLHKDVCANRTVATIATHDLAAIKGPLTYTAHEPDSILIQPLVGGDSVKASKLVQDLKAEAEAFRKQKKRGQVSGIHKYLPLLEGQSLYPCLVDATGVVISFPPVTNSGVTRISPETTSLLIEVTSSTKLGDAKRVADLLLRDMLELGLGKRSDTDAGKALRVEQGRVVDEDGNLRVTYPAKTDLLFPQGQIAVDRM